MDQILTRFAASITELKKNPTALINEADGNPVAILNHNRASAYLVPAEMFEAMMDIMEDVELGRLIDSRQNEIDQAVEVTLDVGTGKRERVYEALKQRRKQKDMVE
ncbi:MAG: type II toxin-antitoxin system prevent-host-death family antitoxin [Desulfobacterales bacterium]|nr:type II toxin-antitoxin system prevent-host-death family antitoxin [Desulfobacterales bacterium]